MLTDAVAAHPAVLTNGRGAFSGALAEFVVAALLFFAKDLPRLLDAQRRAAWEPFEMGALAGQTIGIVGFGDIGRAAAERLRPFGTRILALRQRPEISRGDPLADEVAGRRRRSSSSPAARTPSSSPRRSRRRRAACSAARRSRR